MTISILQFVILFILVTTNILLGCYVAILLGYGPPDWRTALNQVIDLPRLQDYWNIIRTRVTALRVFSHKEDNSDSQTVSDAKSKNKSENIVEAQSGENYEETIRKLTEIQPTELLEDESGKVSDLMPMNEVFDDELASVLKEQGTEAWLVNEKHVETSLLKLNVVLMKSGQFAAELDWRIRSFRGSMTQEDVKQFREELRDDCRNYLESQANITDQMKKRLNEFGELKSLAESVDYANMEQSAQIETTLSNLELIDLNGDPEDAASRLIKELSSLRLARHRLHDMQYRTFLQIIFYEKREDTIPPQLYIDEHFKLRGRVGLEIAINEWWKQKRHEKRQITFALLDFVKFGEANEEHGITVCDKIIEFFGNTLSERFDPLDLTGIYSGNCFMVATINAGPKKTITEIERIRQYCEKATFRYDSGKSSLQLQLTCAVTEALATQSKNDVLAALEKTLAAAKKAGRNHTFHYVPGPLDNPPEKVAAPNLGEVANEIEIT